MRWEEVYEVPSTKDENSPLLLSKPLSASREEGKKQFRRTQEKNPSIQFKTT